MRRLKEKSLSTLSTGIHNFSNVKNVINSFGKVVII